MKHSVRRSALFLLLNIVCLSNLTAGAPRLAVILVIDQLPYHVFASMHQNLVGGLKKLVQSGINFTNAYAPHGLPSTATGHAAFNTGTFAKDHGIIANSWYSDNGERIFADCDNSPHTKIFGASDTMAGKSAHHLMVDGISDTTIMYPSSGCANKVFALSLKSHPAIMCAGHLGKALWFDEQQGKFTSSHAFFEQLPQWLIQFNNDHIIPDSITWCPRHCFSSCFYKNVCPSARIDDLSLFESPIKTHDKVNGIETYKNYLKTPQATQLLFDAARACIEAELSCNREEQLIVWISVSSTDFIGHEFGTQSIPYVDLIYHIDCQFKKFMRFVTRLVKSSDVVWILSSDHGSAPVPELLEQEGYHSAHRIKVTELEDAIRKAAQHLNHDTTLSTTVSAPYVYIAKNNLNTIDAQKRNALFSTIQETLLKNACIKRTWTYEQLKNAVFDPYTPEYNLQQQLYPGRSGNIIFQTAPYCLVSKYTSGTTHESPYNYDTHVPLVMYQKGFVERKIINETVLTLQVAPTIAHLMQVPKPSTCTFSMLPGIAGHEILI
ncbi:alkaline phosphatase family protein [Candidatus Dependentiae bacterium]|nr:alkaline phosphatase family protein [Candidatus Dependentiae bacterium]